MKFTKTTDSETIGRLREELYQRFTAPLDGMWESLYIASSTDFLIENEGETVGYCCIDEQSSLTQIYLSDAQLFRMGEAIRSLSESGLAKSAKLSSMEPISFNACLKHSKSISPNTLCYQFSDAQTVQAELLNMQLATPADADAMRTFFKTQIGFDDTFGYTTNLIERKELFFAEESGEIIATGECRMSDSQPTAADVGVIVNKDHHRKRLGTRVLHTLARKAQQANRHPICSTTEDNIASQKAIAKAGFYCSHVIFDIHFAVK